MNASASVKLRALRHLQFRKVRSPGEEFDVPNATWAALFMRRGLAEEVGDCTDPLRPKKAKLEPPKPKRPKLTPPVVDTERFPQGLRADMVAPLMG